MHENLRTKSISIVIPALNEERNIIAAMEKAIKIGRYFKDFEIIAVDDGSADRTLEHMETIQKRYPHDSIVIVHHEQPHNMGGAFRSGLGAASKNNVMIFSGDNEDDYATTLDLCSHIGEAEIILAYPLKDIRGIDRKLLSGLFRRGMNAIFFMDLKYYTGTNIFKTDAVKELVFPSSFMYMPHLITKLIKQKRNSFIEIGVNKEVSDGTNIWNPRNVWCCFIDTIGLVFDIYLADHIKCFTDRKIRAGSIYKGQMIQERR